MRYLAIGFWINDTGEDFSLSRETNDEDVKKVSDMLCKDCSLPNENLAVVLLVKAAHLAPPSIYKSWRAADGDF